MTDQKIIDEIEKVRSNNNINWMNILRLALAYVENNDNKTLGQETFLLAWS